MESLNIDHSETPIRLFKSNFFEFFTHIHPAVVLVIWLPVVFYGLLRGILDWPMESSKAWIVLAFILGLFLWTLAEYLLHRFLFHYHAKSPTGERIFFLFHGIHHAQPQCKTRLVMPPVVSIPMGLAFFYLFQFLFGVVFFSSHWVGPVFAGFILGYLAYDMTHYATHHFPMRAKVWKSLKRHHMRHHYKTPNARFGVSSPLWDFVFKTTGV